ncbi:hypothetical protein IFR05_015483, partial [Cadophora sp. M221]
NPVWSRALKESCVAFPPIEEELTEGPIAILARLSNPEDSEEDIFSSPPLSPTPRDNSIAPSTSREDRPSEEIKVSDSDSDNDTFHNLTSLSSQVELPISGAFPDDYDLPRPSSRIQNTPLDLQNTASDPNSDPDPDPQPEPPSAPPAVIPPRRKMASTSLNLSESHKLKGIENYPAWRDKVMNIGLSNGIAKYIDPRSRDHTPIYIDIDGDSICIVVL